MRKAGDHWVTIEDLEGGVRLMSRDISNGKDLTMVVAGMLMAARFALAAPERAFEMFRRGCFHQVVKAARSLGENPVATLPVLQLLLDFLLRMRHHAELRAFVLKYEGEPKLRAIDADLVDVTERVAKRLQVNLQSLHRSTQRTMRPAPTPEGEKRMDRCHQCRAADKALRACTRCKAAVYCSVDCQKLHWSYHRRHCTSAKPAAAPDAKVEAVCPEAAPSAPAVEADSAAPATEAPAAAPAVAPAAVTTAFDELD